VVYLGWQDRTRFKSLLSDWNDTNSSIYAISVKDSQEISDIENWFIEEYSGWKTAQASITSDKEILKFSLLEMLVYDLGLKKFSEFERTLDALGNIKKIIIEQSLGNQAKAKDRVQYENNTQNLYLDSDIFQKSLIFENNITTILHAFLSDLKRLSKSNKILFIIKFRMALNYEFCSEFLNWLQDHFFHSTCKIPNIKIVIIMQEGLDNFTTLNDDHKCYIPTLNLEDIHEATKLITKHYEIFCTGVINPDTRTVEYKEFKRKLVLLTKLEND